MVGGYRRLGWGLADYQRGLRITSLLAEAGGIELEGNMSTRPWYDRCLFYLDLGRPTLAELQMRELLSHYQHELEFLERYPDYDRQNLDSDVLEKLNKMPYRRVTIKSETGFIGSQRFSRASAMRYLSRASLWRLNKV
jgi:hypothetical protein